MEHIDPRSLVGVQTSACSLRSLVFSQMAGVIFSDSFKIWRLDWDEKSKSVIKKFDKGKKLSFR